MFSSKVCGRLPKKQQQESMSYMYGPHISSENVYFGADNRVVTNPDLSIDVKPPPAWLIADWMLAKHRGEPLSQMAEYFVSQKSHRNRSLHWLDHYLSNE